MHRRAHRPGADRARQRRGDRVERGPWSCGQGRREASHRRIRAVDQDGIRDGVTGLGPGHETSSRAGIAWRLRSADHPTRRRRRHERQRQSRPRRVRHTILIRVWVRRLRSRDFLERLARNQEAARWRNANMCGPAALETERRAEEASPLRSSGRRSPYAHRDGRSPGLMLKSTTRSADVDP